MRGNHAFVSVAAKLVLIQAAQQVQIAKGSADNECRALGTDRSQDRDPFALRRRELRIHALLPGFLGVGPVGLKAIQYGRGLPCCVTPGQRKGQQLALGRRELLRRSTPTPRRRTRLGDRRRRAIA